MSNYSILPFRFERFEDDYFISNEIGEYVYLNPIDFNSFVNHNLDIESDAYLNLKSKHIVADTNIESVIELLATKYRTKKNFLSEFTSLHMIVASLRCNANCSYCQVSKKNVEDYQFDMDKSTAKKTVDMIFKSPSNNIKIEFQGGEPLLNYKIIKYIINYAEWKNIYHKKNLEFVICTNLTLINEKMLRWISKHKVYISTSIDGPRDLHNKNRPLQKNNNSFESVVEKIKLCREYLGEDSVSALMTTSSYSLGNFPEIIDTYRELGFNSIFLRALNPYGFAKRDEHFLAYPVNKFIEEYKLGLNYIIQINLSGEYFCEDYATILLSRILTPFSTGFVDLQSPSGIAISGVIYDYDGDVYVSDEGRMLASSGDKTFKIGNVNNDKYEEIFNSDYLHELIEYSVAESLPQCSTCAYLSYCGGDPVRNYNEQKDFIGHRPTSDFCKKNKSIIQYLLSLLKEDNPEINKIFWSWILRRNIEL